MAKVSKRFKKEAARELKRLHSRRATEGTKGDPKLLKEAQNMLRAAQQIESKLKRMQSQVRGRDDLYRWVPKRVDEALYNNEGTIDRLNHNPAQRVDMSCRYLEIIEDRGGIIVLLSKDRAKVLGRYPYGPDEQYKSADTARAAAEDRERQIQFFKHSKDAIIWPIPVTGKGRRDRSRRLRGKNHPMWKGD